MYIDNNKDMRKEVNYACTHVPFEIKPFDWPFVLCFCASASSKRERTANTPMAQRLRLPFPGRVALSLALEIDSKPASHIHSPPPSLPTHTGTRTGGSSCVRRRPAASCNSGELEQAGRSPSFAFGALHISSAFQSCWTSPSRRCSWATSTSRCRLSPQCWR